MRTSAAKPKLQRACTGRTRVYDVSLVATVSMNVYADVTAASPTEAATLAVANLRELLPDELRLPTIASDQTIDGIEAYAVTERTT